MAAGCEVRYKKNVEAYFWLIKNFVWILIGFLLIRRPIREFASGSDPSAGNQASLTAGHKAWMIVRLLAGVYCIVVSFWNLISSVAVSFLHHAR